MTEGYLGRLAKYRRAMRLIEAWRCPEGVELVIVGRRTDLEVDVVLLHQGHSARALNLEPDDREECDAMLDFLKDVLMAEVSAAYANKEVDEDLILNMTLAQASRRFHEGLGLAFCKKKGGDER
jgi:hypothetical protein